MPIFLTSAAAISFTSTCEEEETSSEDNGTSSEDEISETDEELRVSSSVVLEGLSEQAEK
ncbi:MAG TPA: hypothetical protein VJ855_02030 [Marinilabiliaceae bacterium]|nr:hypothetical protein [Marinilabiliaceae bacterium]